VHRRALLAGKPGPKPRSGRDKTCEQCGATFYVKASRDHARFCSNDCYLANRWGDSHQVTGTCLVCGAEFTAAASEGRKVCSWECRNQLRSITQRGDQSHFWRGGKTAPYHQEWKAVRRIVVERDGYKCVTCGSTDRIQVHHIIPYRYSQSHDPGNLKTLCRSCHSREEFRVNPAFVEGLGRRWPTQQDDPEPSPD